MDLPDRLNKIKNQNDVTGIDYIHVDRNFHNGKALILIEVHFLETKEKKAETLLGKLSKNSIEIRSISKSGPESSGKIEISEDPKWDKKIDGVISDSNQLNVLVSPPGDRGIYQLSINHQNIDPYFNNIHFIFQAGCERDLDCKQDDPYCPEKPQKQISTDYSARDFNSFRNALFEFASFHYPGWKERNEADTGVMLLEVMAALGDEMAYYQDRVAREAYLETASQRRSVRHHARLVDYHVHDGLGAHAWLDVTVTKGKKDDLLAGTGVWAVNEHGERINFEIGNGINDAKQDETPRSYSVDSILNRLKPHIWDKDATCLPVGSTSIDCIADKNVDYINAGLKQGKWMMLVSRPTTRHLLSKAHLVRLNKDPVSLIDEISKLSILRLTWHEEHATPFEMDLVDNLNIKCNTVPVTAGRTEEEYFSIGGKENQIFSLEGKKITAKRAIERRGHDKTIIYLKSLKYSEKENLVWLGNNPHEAYPEIILEEGFIKNGKWNKKSNRKEDGWSWRRTFQGKHSSQSTDKHFTLDDGIWKRLAGYRRGGEVFEHRDYALNRGFTIRFGDGEFGMVPVEGTLFKVSYRIGGDKASNVATGAISNIGETVKGSIQLVSNPMLASGGMDPQTYNEIKQLAPEAFRAVTYRAVRPEDYVEAAERLKWIQRAGTKFRWTGSWHTAFLTPDPLEKVRYDQEKRTDLLEYIDRFRQTGREAAISDPVYADLDFEITICASKEVYKGEVQKRVIEVLLGNKGDRGYFSADNFTFGTSLSRSSLDAVIQSVEGVKAVEQIRFRRRGWFTMKVFDTPEYDPGTSTIIRIENNPVHPERGTVKLIMKGGA